MKTIGDTLVAISATSLASRRDSRHGVAEGGRGWIGNRGGGGGGWRGFDWGGGSQPQKARDASPVGAGWAPPKGVDELRRKWCQFPL